MTCIGAEHDIIALGPEGDAEALSYCPGYHPHHRKRHTAGKTLLPQGFYNHGKDFFDNYVKKNKLYLKNFQ